MKMEAACTSETLATLLTYTPSNNLNNIDNNNNNNTNDHNAAADDNDDSDTDTDNDDSLLHMNICSSMQYRFLYQWDIIL